MGLDPIDAKILDLLQRDGRASHSAIAEAVGLSQPSVHERVKKLEQRGLIKGYTAIVDPDALDLPVLAFISVRFSDKIESTWKAVVEIPEVLEAHHTAGEDCLLVKARCRTPQDLERVVDRIWDSGSVAATKTTIAFSSYKETLALPLGNFLPENEREALSA